MPGPRPIRFSAAEIAFLLADGLSPGGGKLMAKVVGKLEAALEPAPKGAAVAPLEAALEHACPGKVARLLPSGYGRASKRAAQLGATPDDVTTVGRWLHRWWTRGTVTLLDVLNRWDTWLPKARAEAGPQGLSEGFDVKADVGQGARTGSSPVAQGRSPAGFR
jgi:hypothetical protein